MVCKILNLKNARDLHTLKSNIHIYAPALTDDEHYCRIISAFYYGNRRNMHAHVNQVNNVDKNSIQANHHHRNHIKVTNSTSHQHLFKRFHPVIMQDRVAAPPVVGTICRCASRRNFITHFSIARTASYLCTFLALWHYCTCNVSTFVNYEMIEHS